MNRSKVALAIRSISLAGGYMSLLMQWLWVSIIGLPPLIKSGAFDDIIGNVPKQQVSVSQSAQPELSPVILLFVGMLTLIFLVITVVIFIRLPRTISKTGQQVVEQVADTIVPALTHHKTLPAKKQRELSRNVIFGIQLVLVFMPLCVALFLKPIDDLTREVINTVAIAFFATSLVSFSLTRLLPVPKTTSRTRSHESRE